MLKTFADYSFTLLGRFPTCDLDIFPTNRPNLIHQCSIEPDREMIYASISCIAMKSPRTEHRLYLWNSENFDGLKIVARMVQRSSAEVFC